MQICSLKAMGFLLIIHCGYFFEKHPHIYAFYAKTGLQNFVTLGCSRISPCFNILTKTYREFIKK